MQNDLSNRTLETITLQHDNGKDLVFTGRLFSECSWFDDENSTLTRQKLYVTENNEHIYYIVSGSGDERSRRVYNISVHGDHCVIRNGKKEWFARGVAELTRGDLSKGQATLASLIREFKNDAELKGSVGEALIQVALYEPAIDYLTEAIDDKPDMLPLYNLIGIALRRLKKFETAESYYLRASNYLRSDPNLYFNIGRLYLDWGKWKKAAKSAEIALKLDPNFIEAQKLLKYVNKQIEEKGANE